MQYTLTVTEGDTLEFDASIQQGNTAYELQEGDKLWFLVDGGEQDDISIEQETTAFKIQKVVLSPGIYEFELGIIFSNGDRKTLCKHTESRLTVLDHAGGHLLCKS